MYIYTVVDEVVFAKMVYIVIVVVVVDGYSSIWGNGWCRVVVVVKVIEVVVG